MMIFSGDNISLIYYNILEYFNQRDFPLKESRLGLVRDIGSICLEVYDDEFRLLSLKKRNINPFFALVEYSWMIIGENNVKPLKNFISNYNIYTDDGYKLNGAYGHRIKYYFGFDQIESVINILKSDKNSRRAVVSLWSSDDLGKESNDLPCNTQIFFKIINGKLDITVINRSNDLFLGLPYDIFVFYMLQSYISRALCLENGIQRHYIDSLHVYKKDFKSINDIVRYNNVKSIECINEYYNAYNIKQYLYEQHDLISAGIYDNIRDNTIKKLFDSYSFYKKNNDSYGAIKLLPDNILGYVAFNWLMRNTKNKELKEMNMRERFDGIINLPEKELEKFIWDIVAQCNGLFNKLISVIDKDDYGFDIDMNDKEQILRYIVLSIMLSVNIGDKLYNYFLDFDLEKIKKISALYNLKYSYVVKLAKYEKSFIEILDNNCINK